jgi:hypothetical protein
VPAARPSTFRRDTVLGSTVISPCSRAAASRGQSVV